MCPTYDFRQEILSHGAEVEVLSPQWFRDEITAIAGGMCKLYANH
ncbi:MAG: WYL domain-containing protein [Tannerellaceae bacterium]|nr:WYL domain-containing protein [Tannerellaceae bacterium]